MQTKVGIFFVTFLNFSCIGVDHVDDPVVGARIDVDPLQIALRPSESFTLEARYFDLYGIRQPVTFSWTSSNTPVAEVNQSGVVTAKSPGQSVVQAQFGSVFSESINVTVVPDDNAVAIVEIASSNSTVGIGEMVQVEVTVKNINNEPITGKEVEWFSENSQILSVNGMGKITGNNPGVAGVHAKVEGVKSNSIDFTVTTVRTGTFVPSGGYKAAGTATLKVENDDLVLTLSDNFETSFALGTYIYLANSTNGPTVRANGFEVAQITTNGSKTFIISDINPLIGLYDYRYVIILCKPASVTFGYADLN